jgi:hypothetical protein
MFKMDSNFHLICNNNNSQSCHNNKDRYKCFLHNIEQVMIDVLVVFFLEYYYFDCFE